MARKLPSIMRRRVAGTMRPASYNRCKDKGIELERFVGLGTLPLHVPSLAVTELERCMGDLRLKGVAISTMAGTMELGDPQLRAFWAKAEALGAVVYIHPGGNRDRRFKRFHLWNSVGQASGHVAAPASPAMNPRRLVIQSPHRRARAGGAAR